jgi:hypothetical protein
MILADKIAEKAIGVANVFLTAIGVISLGAWAYSIYYYVWTGVRQLGSTFDIVLFICCPPVVASLIFASLRLNPARRVRLAMLCLSTVACLYAAEVLLILLPSLLGIAVRPATTSVDGASEKRKNEIRRLAEKFGVKFDTRDRIEVLIDAQSRGIDAVPAVYPRALLEPQQGGSLKSIIRIKGAEVLPLGGISNKTSLLCNETGDYIFYQSDEHGFHNPKGLWNSARLDVAVLGDFVRAWILCSLTQTLYCSYPRTLSSYVESGAGRQWATFGIGNPQGILALLEAQDHPVGLFRKK